MALSFLHFTFCSFFLYSNTVLVILQASLADKKNNLIIYEKRMSINNVNKFDLIKDAI